MRQLAGPDALFRVAAFSRREWAGRYRKAAARPEVRAALDARARPLSADIVAALEKAEAAD